MLQLASVEEWDGEGNADTNKLPSVLLEGLACIMEESVAIPVTEEKVVWCIKEQKSRAEQRLTHSWGRGSRHKVTAFGSGLRGPIQH